MQVRMAEHYGMCFGVRDAIELAVELTEKQTITILGDLVHNPDVVAHLDGRGANRVRSVDGIPTRTVLLTAHGTADRTRLQLKQLGHEVHDATCPLVTRVHLAVHKLQADGFFPIVVGQKDHVEVRGLTDDLDDYEILLTTQDLERIATRFADQPTVRLGVVSQTTQPVEVVRELVDELRQRLPHSTIRLVDTVCQPTKDRQSSLRKLTEESDVLIVVGGPDSNNSRKLTELARKLGKPAYQVSRAEEVDPNWLQGAQVVGLTAGTSTPDEIIQQVRHRLENL